VRLRFMSATAAYGDRERCVQCAGAVIGQNHGWFASTAVSCHQPALLVHRPSPAVDSARDEEMQPVRCGHTCDSPRVGVWQRPEQLTRRTVVAPHVAVAPPRRDVAKKYKARSTRSIPLK